MLFLIYYKNPLSSLDYNLYVAVYSMWRHETFTTIFMQLAKFSVKQLRNDNPHIKASIYVDIGIAYTNIHIYRVKCCAKLFALKFARSSTRSLDNPLNFCWVQLNFTFHFMLSTCNKKFYTYALSLCVCVRWSVRLYCNWRMEYLKLRRLAAVFCHIQVCISCTVGQNEYDFDKNEIRYVGLPHLVAYLSVKRFRFDVWY